MHCLLSTLSYIAVVNVDFCLALPCPGDDRSRCACPCLVTFQAKLLVMMKLDHSRGFCDSANIYPYKQSNQRWSNDVKMNQLQTFADQFLHHDLDEQHKRIRSSNTDWAGLIVGFRCDPECPLTPDDQYAQYKVYMPQRVEYPVPESLSETDIRSFMRCIPIHRLYTRA